jgi:hypothetical protein
MSLAGRVSAVTAFFALVLVGLLLQTDTRQLTRSSYGAIPGAHGVLYDTLEELELPVSRSFARMERLPPTATLWWIEPARLIGADEKLDAGAGEEAEPKAADPDPDADAEGERLSRRLRGRPQQSLTPALRDLAGTALGDWIASGGTALVFLGGEGLGAVRVADVVVPARERLNPAPAGEASAPGSATSTLRDPIRVELRGELLPARRSIALVDPLTFVDPPPEWRTRVWAAGRPFALERSLGEGRLVVVSDVGFLSNRLFPRGDAAPFALDLARAYGVPRIDERAHGFSASRGVIATLAASPVAFCFAGLALCGMVFAWLGGSLPRRSVGDAALPAPTLEGYVDAMASYYGATREYGRVLARYRDLSARRLRRALALPPDAPLASVVERAARSKRADPEALELLAKGAPARDLRALVQSARKLDEMVRRIAT